MEPDVSIGEYIYAGLLLAALALCMVSAIVAPFLKERERDE